MTRHPQTSLQVAGLSLEVIPLSGRPYRCKQSNEVSHFAQDQLCSETLQDILYYTRFAVLILAGSV